MSEPLLKIEGLVKTFEDDFTVLDGIDLTAQEGEFVCIVGPSGCGKTVLLYLIAGFLRPTAGTITLRGDPVTTYGRDRMMVFQDYILFPWKTVYGNVLIGLTNTPYSAQEKEQRVLQHLELVGLAQFRDWPIAKLSGGMQQRVAIARALIADPAILLMDEPFAALDSQYRKFMRQQVLEIWRRTKKTVLFVTHSIGEAMSLADTIYVMGARPSTVRRVIPMTEPRPRDTNSPACVAIHRDIESCIAQGFREPSADELTHVTDQLIYREVA